MADDGGLVELLDQLLSENQELRNKLAELEGAYRGAVDASNHWRRQYADAQAMIDAFTDVYRKEVEACEAAKARVRELTKGEHRPPLN